MPDRSARFEGEARVHGTFGIGTRGRVRRARFDGSTMARCLERRGIEDFDGTSTGTFLSVCVPSSRRTA